MNQSTTLSYIFHAVIHIKGGQSIYYLITIESRSPTLCPLESHHNPRDFSHATKNDGLFLLSLSSFITGFFSSVFLYTLKKITVVLCSFTESVFSPNDFVNIEKSANKDADIVSAREAALVQQKVTDITDKNW